MSRAERKKQEQKLNIQILLLAVLIVFGLFTAQGLDSTMLSALAMEQDAVCGMEEHVHDDSCYNEWDILQCGKAAHTHTSNCYMVLLEDNDINTLLEEVDAAEDHSLNNLVATASSAPQATIGTAISGSAIATQTRSTLVLNDNLVTAADLETSAGNGGISTLAVGDEPSSSGRHVNLYVYIDGRWTCIGDLSWQWYNPNIKVESIVNLVNSSLGVSLINFDLVYAESANVDSGTKVDLSDKESVSFVDGIFDDPTIYARIVPPGGDWSNTGLSFNTVIYNYLNGTSQTKYVRTGATVTLPASEGGWLDNIGTGSYHEGGTTVTIKQRTIFTEQEAAKAYYIGYDVNFPTVNGITVTTEPTVMGGETYDQLVEDGQIAPIYNVSSTKVEGTWNNTSSPGLSRVFRFMGWRVGNTDTIIQPGASLTWETLQTYGNSLTLSGVWEYDARHTVSFFVSYASAMVDSNGNIITDTSKFTPQIYAAFLKGDDLDSLPYDQLHTKYRVETEDPDDVESNVKADQDIRALYGEQEGVWMETFPSDEYVFSELRKYADQLSVDGIAVDAEDLNDNGYTIRWYVFKCQSDAWHVDGVLVRKAGNMEVTKSFAGNKDAIEAIKDGNFYIQATGGGRIENLTLSNYDSYDVASDKYTWLIEDISYGEKWKLQEMNYGSAYAEYRVVDASGEQSAAGKYTGSPVEVTGMTYAVDIGAEVMSVDFTNIYKGYDSLIIKKEDSRTRLPLAGAGFTLMQNGQPLTFTHDAENNIYTCDPSGSVSELSGGTSGFVEISITGLDFSAGDITVHESTVPDGYSIRDDIVLTKSSGEITVLSGDDAVLEKGVLIIGNDSDIVSVTVEKTWSDPEDAEDVTIQLLANDRLVSTLVTGANAEAVLNAANNYKYTWDNLPRYANGQKVNWSVREVQIGSEQCKSDFTFSNWIVTYGTAQETERDGKYTTKLAVTNTHKDAVTLLMFKVNQNNERVSGATFKLELLYDDGTVNSAFTAQTLTTDATGLLSFANLPYGKYRLTEVEPPPGFNGLTEPILLQISDNHRASIISGSNVSIVSAENLSIRVENHSDNPLPETGGSTPYAFWLAGAALMLLACLIALNTVVMHRREKRS